MQCNKIGFISKSEAKAYIKQVEFNRTRYSNQNKTAKSGRKMNVYECKRCGQWHLTTVKPKKYLKW